jgi:hypothetical protein
MPKTKAKKETKAPMTSYRACGIIEGFDCENPTEQEFIEAWSFLIKTGQCWTLQGFYGRTAHSLIENGVIAKDGTILSRLSEEV